MGFGVIFTMGIRLKIAQVAPLYESVPPKLYGGTERIVSYLTEALVELGHDVTLYASGDSVTQAKLRSVCPRALRLDKHSIDANADHVFLAEKCFQESSEFDVMHSHIDYGAFPLLRRMATPHVTTLHGRLDVPNLRNLYREFADEPVVSISDSQRSPLAWVNWRATVYHGLPKNFIRFMKSQERISRFSDASVLKRVLTTLSKPPGRPNCP
jgi:glycosyltransferase involved in cell wall biosynthesis